MYPLVGTERARQDIPYAFRQYDLMANIQKLVSTVVLPLVPVELAHGTYPKLPIKELMKGLEDTGQAEGHELDRAPRGAYRTHDHAFTQEPYTTGERGLAGVVDRNEAQHYRAHFDHEVETALKTLHLVLIEREKRTAGKCFSTSVFTGNNVDGGLSQDAGTYQADLLVGGSAVPWSDWANSKPRDDIFFARSKVFQRCGTYPRSLLISEDTFRDLRMNAQIRSEWISLGVAHGHARAIADMDLALTGNNRDASISALAEVLEVDELIVGASVIDANDVNTSAFKAQHLWGRSALLFVRVQRTGAPSLEDIGLGHTLQFVEGVSNDPNAVANNYGFGVEQGFYVEDYWDTERRAQKIRVRHQDDQLIKYVECGELITSV